MAIDSYDAILAAIAAGKSQEIQFSKTLTTLGTAQAASTWTLGETPPAGGAGTSLVMRACNNTTTGALSFANPASDDDNLYLVSWNAWGSIASLGTLILYDRIADVSGINLATTTPNDITSVTLPRYATGAGVQMFLTVTTTITGAPVFTVEYTDQDGNAAATTSAVTCAANAATRLAYSGQVWLPLAAGDTGVRAVDNLTCSVAGGAGVATLVLARPIARLPLINLGTVIERDLVTQIPKLPILQDDHCLNFLVYGATASVGTISGSLTAVAG